MLELRIAKPCDQTWTAMKGDEQVRHCQRCEENVYNISQMTEAEVEALILRTEGRFCARLYRRTDGRVMTKDCPKGMAAVRRRGVLAVAAAGATMAYAFSFVRSLNEPEPKMQTLGMIAVIPKREKAVEEFSEPTTLGVTVGQLDYPRIRKVSSKHDEKQESPIETLDRLPPPIELSEQDRRL